MSTPVLTVDIDVGGTLTDGIFIRDGAISCVKVDTTPHDLTVCLFDCLTQGATQLGFDDVDTFLENVDLIRWSTTITSNVLAEQRGPRLGLIVSRGHESDFYGETQRSTVAGPADFRGERHRRRMRRRRKRKSCRPLEAAGDGVRRICVSLEGCRSRSRAGDSHQAGHRATVSRSFSRLGTGSGWQRHWPRRRRSHANVLRVDQRVHARRARGDAVQGGRRTAGHRIVIKARFSSATSTAASRASPRPRRSIRSSRARSWAFTEAVIWRRSSDWTT